MKDILRPRGRLAHSTENRVGQAWRSGSVQVMGEDIFGQAKVFSLPSGHFLCKKCDAVVRIDARGFAACDVCGEIYNDFSEVKIVSRRAQKRRMEEFKYKMIQLSMGGRSVQ